MEFVNALKLDVPNQHPAIIFDEVQNFIQVNFRFIVANDGFPDPIAFELGIDDGVSLVVILGHLREKFDFFDFVSSHFS